MSVLAAFTHTLNHTDIMEDTDAALQPLQPCLHSPAFWRRYMRLMAAPAGLVEPYWRQGGWGTNQKEFPRISRAGVLLESYQLLTEDQAYKVGGHGHW